MFLLRRPSPAAIERFLTAQAPSCLTYAPMGLSSFPRPRGFTVDHQWVRVGAGPAAFTAACRALADWEHFRLGWVEVYPQGPPTVAGTNVAVLARHAGFWSLNACRVVAPLTTSADGIRCAFAYGTLADHAERGEELFAVALDPADGAVWYEIRAVARPRALLAWLGYPLTRHFQARFRRDSARVLARAASFAADS